MLNQEWLTPKEIAELLHVHSNTVRNWIRYHGLTSYRTPTGYYFIHSDDLMKFLPRLNPEEEQE